MEKQQIGRSDLFISRYTLGCMSLGSDEKIARSIIDQAIDLGVNHLDTADLYDFGINEEIVGQAIKDRRQEIIVTSKVGNHFNQKDKSWYWDPSRAYIEKAINKSLNRLQTDYIDLYLLHGGTIDDPIDETIEAFERLKEKGVIRAYGISSIRPNVIRSYMQHSSIDAIMMQYNMLDRRPESLFNNIHENNVSVLARGPLAKGLLTKKWETTITNKAKDGYLDYDSKELHTTLATLHDIFEGDISRQALQYVLHHPVVVSAVFGASKSTQVLDLIDNIAPHVMMSDEQYNTVQTVTKPLQYTAHL